MKLAKPVGWAPRALVFLSLAFVGVFLWSSQGSGLAQEGGAEAKEPAADAKDTADAKKAAKGAKKTAKAADDGGPSEKAADSSAEGESGTSASGGTKALVLICWLLSVAGSITALVFARKFYLWMMEQDEGNEQMIEIAQAVRDGADAYLKRQYRVVGIFFAIACAALMFVSFVLDAQRHTRHAHRASAGR